MLSEGLDPSNEPKRARRKKEVEPAPGPAPAPELPEPSPPESPQPSPPASTAQLLGAKTTMLDGVHRQSMGVAWSGMELSTVVFRHVWKQRLALRRAHIIGLVILAEVAGHCTTMLLFQALLPHTQ